MSSSVEIGRYRSETGTDRHRGFEIIAIGYACLSKIDN
jgi:hypothetical protein